MLKLKKDVDGHNCYSAVKNKLSGKKTTRDIVDAKNDLYSSF